MTAAECAALAGRITKGGWAFQPQGPKEVEIKRRHNAVGQATAPNRGIAYVFAADLDPDNDANAEAIAALPKILALVATQAAQIERQAKALEQAEAALVACVDSSGSRDGGPCKCGACAMANTALAAIRALKEPEAIEAAGR